MRLLGTTMLLLALASSAAAVAQGDDRLKALAPDGSLRIAFLSGPLYATKDASSGELKGVAIDLGHGLSHRLGASVKPVVYSSPGALIAGAKSGDWDVALMGVSDERAAMVDFSPSYMEVEQGYLVRPGLEMSKASELDQRGVRVGVVENAGADVHLSRTLTNATLVRVKSLPELEALIATRQADAIAATKSFLHGRLQQMPGARVLEGRLLVEHVAIALPKGKDAAAMAVITEFVHEAKRSGLVARAIERAGLKGVDVAR